MVPLAQKAGLPFTYEEAAEYVTSGRELDDDELEAVAGGGSYCYAIGGSSEPLADECTAGEGFEFGVNACAYVGVGVLSTD